MSVPVERGVAGGAIPSVRLATRASSTLQRLTTRIAMGSRKPRCGDPSVRPSGGISISGFGGSLIYVRLLFSFYA
jgi:hypothetical protein